MKRAIEVGLVLAGAVLVFGPFLVLDAAGGREAIVVITGMQPNGVLLAAGYFLAWVGMVFVSVPYLAGAAAFLLVR